MDTADVKADKDGGRRDHGGQGAESCTRQDNVSYASSRMATPTPAVAGSKRGWSAFREKICQACGATVRLGHAHDRTHSLCVVLKTRGRRDATRV